jgi:8-oxo-dGTP pyrophosphatase MutT (NUDIX family)
VIDLAGIRGALAGHRPTLVALDGRGRAAVAVVLRERAGLPEVLLIERARRAGDPWSGHMAFPGGRVERGDSHLREAAERETLEEVGIDLAGSEVLGRLDDLEGRRAAEARGLVISAFVYHVADPPELAINHEVQEAFWVPLAWLHDRARHVEHPWPAVGARLPGILVGEPGRHVVWGLTYRFLEVFFDVVGRPLPGRWIDSERERCSAS